MAKSWSLDEFGGQPSGDAAQAAPAKPPQSRWSVEDFAGSPPPETPPPSQLPPTLSPQGYDELGLPLPQITPPKTVWDKAILGSGTTGWGNPEPNTEYSGAPWVPIARDTKTGELRPAIPGPFMTGMNPRTGTQFNPVTGIPSLTPEAQAALGILAPESLRFGGTPPRAPLDQEHFVDTPPPDNTPTITVTAHAPPANENVPSTTFTTSKGSTYEAHPPAEGADVGSTTRNKSFHPEHGPGDQGPQPRSNQTYYVTPEDVQKLGEVQTQGGAGKKIAPLNDGTGRIGMQYTDGPHAGKFEGRTVVTPDTEPDVSLHPVELWDDQSPHFGNQITHVQRPPEPEPVTSTPSITALRPDPNLQEVLNLPSGTKPASAAEAKKIASAYYAWAKRLGGTLTPAFVNKFIDTLAATRVPEGVSELVKGTQHPYNAFLDRLEQQRGQSWDLDKVQAIDQELGDQISNAFGQRLSGEGEMWRNTQQTLRDHIDNAASGDITGGRQGFQALDKGRQAWSAARRMEDLERVQQIARDTEAAGGDAARSIRAQLKQMLNTPKRMRGYNYAEIRAIRRAARQGKIGGLIDLFGDRFVGMAAMMSEMGTHGLAGGLAAGVGAHLARSGVRYTTGRIQTGRLAGAHQTVAGRVPPMPPPLPPQRTMPPTGGWRSVRPGEIHPPGRQFRMNMTTGQREVFEPPPPPANQP
jgi:hypothetical protein